MSQRPNKVTNLQQPEDINRLIRRLRREASTASVAAAQAQQPLQPTIVANIAQPDLPDSPGQPPAITMANPPQQAQLPTLLKLADTNPYTNLSDLTTENGRRLWRQATEPLADKFDGSHQNFQDFSASITNRFKMCNWFRFINFTVGGISRDLITNPGMISLSTVQNARNNRANILENPPSGQHITAEDINTYNNAVISQLQSEMMYHFLANSIATPLKTHISQKIMSGLIHEDGPLLLKYIQEKVKGRANKQQTGCPKCPGCPPKPQPQRVQVQCQETT